MREQLIQVLDSGSAGFGLVDEDAVLLAANQRMADALGHPLDAIIGQRAWQLGPNFDEDAWARIRDAVDVAGAMETETLSPQGGRLALSRLRIEVAPPGPEGGRRYLVRSEPIAGAATPEGEHWLRAISRYGRDAFWAWSRGAEAVTVQDRWCAMLGWAPREAVAIATLVEITHPDDRATTQAQMRALIHGEVEQVEGRVRMRHADGSYRWIHHRAYVVARGPDGRPSWLMGHDLDVTAQAEAEAQALARERELKTLIERVATAVMVFDADGELVRWNAAAARMSGVPSHALPAVVSRLNRSCATGAVDESGALLSREELPIEIVMRTGEPVLDRVIGVVMGGRRRWASVSAVPGHDADGRVVDVVVTAAEITETRRLQEALTRRRWRDRMGRVAGGVAHHVNNLLTVIGTSAELIAHAAPTDGRLAVEVADLRAAVARGAGMVRQLLGYAARQDRIVEVLDVGAALAASPALARRLLPTGVRYTVTTPPTLRRVRLDPGQLDQIIVNLLVNAGEALAGRVGAVSVEARDERCEGVDYVVVTVRDDGPGMAPEVARHAKEPFFTTKGLATAYGLGLSACHGIAAQNGGGLEVESAPGQGTRVEVWLPAAGEGEG